MTGKTHFAFGLGTGVLSAALLNGGSPIIGGGIICASMAGSLLPDLDSVTSTLGKKIKPISKLITKVFGHRGFLHSPICMLLILMFWDFILNHYKITQYMPIVYGLLIGYGGHLFLDFLTKGGIPLLFPFKKKKYHLTNVKTGGKGEKILFIVACIFVVALLIIYFIYGAKIGAFFTDITKNSRVIRLLF